jgi:hypothetical protein
LTPPPGLRRTSPDLTDLGIVVAACATLFSARHVIEQTWLSYSRGEEFVRYALGSGAMEMAALSLAILWAILVFVCRALWRRPISRLDVGLLILVALSVVVHTVPSEQWRLATARVAGARNVPGDWVVWSAARGETRLLGYLLEHGANANARVLNGQTALGAAASAGELAACELLINHGARLDGHTRITRQTPLIEAAQEGRLEVVRLLLRRGAETATRDAAGLTAEDWAAGNGDNLMIRILHGERPSF